MGKTKFELPPRPEALIEIEERRSRIGRERRALETQIADLSNRAARDRLPSREDLVRRAEIVGRELRTVRGMLDELDTALAAGDDARLARRKMAVLDRYEKLRGEAVEIDEAIEQGRFRPVDETEAQAEKLAKGEISEVSRPEALAAVQSKFQIVRRAEQKIVEELTSARAAYNRSIAAGLREPHRKAVARIYRALCELESANREELAVRSVVPGLPMTRCGFPNIGERGPAGGPFQFWFQHVRRAGLLDADDEPDLLAAE